MSLTLGVTLILFAPLLYLFYWFTTSTFGFWKKLKVPHLKPLPLIGNFPVGNKVSVLEYIKSLYFKFPEDDYFGIWLMRRPTLLVRSPELVKRILVKDFDHFFDRYATSGEHDPWGKYNIFCCDQPIWGEIRKRLTPVFTSTKLKSYQMIMLDKSNKFVRLLSEGRHDVYVTGNVYNPAFYRMPRHSIECLKRSGNELSRRYATDVITSTSFGFEANTLEDEDSPLREIAKRMTDTSGLRRRLEIVVAFYMPELSSLFRNYFFSKFTSTHFTKIYKQIEAEKKITPSKTECLLDALSKCRGEIVSDGIVLTDEIVVAQGVVFLFASVESSANFILLALLEITHRPDIQERVYREIDAALQKYGQLNYEAVSELVFLEQCIKETLRKYPVIATLDRKCMKDYQVDDKLTIPKGTSVMINIAGIQHDPKYYPNPEVWDPERFNPENEITPFTFLPFGEGPKNCIGMRYAIVSLKTVIAVVLANNEIRKDSTTLHPDDLTFSPLDVLPHPVQKVHIKCVRRDKQ